MSEEKQLEQRDLDMFSGTELWHQHPFYRWMTYTDGAEYFLETAGAYWFLDIVGSELQALARREEFLHIQLKVSEDSNRAEIVADDGNDNVVYFRPVDYTDCPKGTWHFYLEAGGPDGGFVLLLPSEH